MVSVSFSWCDNSGHWFQPGSDGWGEQVRGTLGPRSSGSWQSTRWTGSSTASPCLRSPLSTPEGNQWVVFNAKKIWGCQPTLIGIFFDISWRPKTHASKLERLWSDEAYKWPHRLACLAHGHNICSMPANQGPMQSAYCLTTPTQMNPTILSFADIILISR